MLKTFLPLLLLINATTADAQMIKKYYDWQWKECGAADARFQSITIKTDSGWLRGDFYASINKPKMRGLYADSAWKQQQGWFRYYYANGQLSSQGRYVDGKKEGLWLQYHYSGQLKDSGVYDKGRLFGVWKRWHNNGAISDSPAYDNDETWIVSRFDNGMLSADKHFTGKDKDGNWQFYHKNGTIAAQEKYEQGQLVFRQYFDEDGVAIKDTANKDRDAVFKGGAKAWRKYLEKKLYFPDGYKIKNTDAITVVVSATIDEEGNVVDAYVDIPIHAALDNIALEAMRKSPKWDPAIDHNRRVKSFVRQPVRFGMYDGF